MNANTPCPCCGHIVTAEEGLRWNELTRTLCGLGYVVALRPMQGKIFDKLWRSWPSGRMISKEEMMDHVYADDINGGPESPNIVSVQIADLRKRIAPFGISIHGRHGYLIYRVANPKPGRPPAKQFAMVARA